MKLLLLSIVLLNTKTSNNIYLMQGTVADTSNGIYIDTGDGNGWYFENEYKNKLEIGDKIIIEFDNMWTSDINDDELLNVYKAM